MDLFTWSAIGAWGGSLPHERGRRRGLWEALQHSASGAAGRRCLGIYGASTAGPLQISHIHIHLVPLSRSKPQLDAAFVNLCDLRDSISRPKLRYALADFESIYQDAGYDNWDDYEANDFRTAREVDLEEAAQERKWEEAIERERTAEKVRDAAYDYPDLHDSHSHGAFDH